MYACYVRVSTREQLQGYGIEVQIQQIKRFLEGEQFNHQRAVWFKDFGKSAGNLNRPELKKVLDLVKEQKVKKIFVYKIDRLTRNLKDLIYLVDFFDKQNVELHSIHQEINLNTAMGRFNLNLMGIIAEWERETIRERTLDGLIESARKGNFPVGRAPYGFYKKDNKLYIDTNLKKIVQKIFSDYSNFKNIDVIIEWLQAVDPMKRFWNRKKVYKIIKNPLYKGTFAYYGVIIEKYITPLISEELWEKVNSFRSFRKKRKENYLFYNLIYHPHCSSNPLTHVSGTSHTKQKYYYYYCSVCKKNESEINLLKLFRKAYKIFNVRKNKLLKEKQLRRLEVRKKQVMDIYFNQAIDRDKFTEITTELDKKIQMIKENFYEDIPIKDLIFKKTRRRLSRGIAGMLNKIIVDTQENQKIFEFTNDYKIAILNKMNKKD